MGRPVPYPTPDDEESFFLALLPVVTAWCARLARPGVDVESAAQEVMVVLVRRRADLRPGAPPLPWAWGITKRVIRWHARTAWMRRWLPGDVEPLAPSDPHADLAAAERARVVHTILHRLGEAHREVLVLCDVEERSRPEVAALLGLPEGTVKSRLRLAREAFRAEAARAGITLFRLVEEDRDG